MGSSVYKHKHLKLDQKKIDFAKRYFGVESEQEAIDRALPLLQEVEQILALIKPLKGSLKSDRRPWPYRLPARCCLIRTFSLITCAQTSVRLGFLAPQAVTPASFPPSC